MNISLTFPLGHKKFIFSATGGGTYCAVAALRLMGFIEADILSKSTLGTTINVPLLLEWCIQVLFSLSFNHCSEHDFYE